MRRILVTLVIVLWVCGLGFGQGKKSGKGIISVGSKCDRLAAHPHDKSSRVKGVNDKLLDAEAAISACELEVERASAIAPRLAFQLARAYLKAGREAEAVEQLLIAGKAGHAGALAYLGDIYLDGLAGIEADPDLAYALYQRSAKGGFSPAVALLKEFEDYAETSDLANEGLATDARTKYLSPEIIDNILKGDLNAVPFGEMYTKLYLAHMADNFAEECKAPFTANEVDALKRDAVLKTIEMSAEAGLATAFGQLVLLANALEGKSTVVQEVAESYADPDQVPLDAMKDAFAMMGRYGCGSKQIKQFGTNLTSYIRNEGAPTISTEALNQKCQREARPTGRYNATNFCMCFVPVLTQVPVSRANRIDLSNNFWPTAQKMMSDKPGSFATCNK